MVRLHRASARLLAIARSQNLKSRHDYRSQRPHPLLVDFRDVCPAYDKELLCENDFAVEAIDLMVNHAEFIAIFTHEMHGLERSSPRELELIFTLELVQ